MLFQVMIYNFRGPWGPSSPSNAPQNSPQILLFLGDEPQIAARKANESKNWFYLKVQAVIQKLFSCCSSET